MLLLTLNMNMFNFVIDDSFNDYFDSISTDIAFIQECRYNRINEQYYAKWAGNYEEPIDRRFHLSVAISKDDKTSKIKGCKNESLADRLIKNTYKVLLTRGQKGCYIYCEDKSLSEYIKERIS